MTIDIVLKNNNSIVVHRDDGDIADEFTIPTPEWTAANVNSLTKIRLAVLNSYFKRKFIPLFDLYENKWIIGVIDNPYDPTRYKVRSWDKFKSLNNCIRDLKKLNKTDTYEEPTICRKCGRVFILSKKESGFYSSRNLVNPLTCFDCRGADNVQQPRTLVDYHQDEHDMYLEFEELNDNVVNEFLPIFTEETYTTKTKTTA